MVEGPATEERPTPPVRRAAILVAAGRSTRMGSDKLWVELWGRPTWRWGLDTLLSSPAMERVAVIVPADAVDRFSARLPDWGRDRCVVAAGGELRADSVVAGLWALTQAGYEDSTLVLVHDAARPAVTVELIRRVANAAATGQHAVVPVVRAVDSLKQVRADRVVAAADRDEVVSAQTPQAARLGTLRAAIEEARAWNRPMTDDVGALAASGVSIRTVPGDPVNAKLTEPADLAAMRGVLAARASPLVAPGTAADLPQGVRCGIGFDAHRLVAGRPMRIGGVLFAEEERGPTGHSDGDAVLHALIDALLGAAQLGDVGTLFPPDEPAWEGADSTDLVRRAVERLTQNGWHPAAADVAVVVARPAIAPRRREMVEAIAAMLGIGADAVSVAGTTSDGLGFAGEEGIAAWAVAAVARSA